MTRSRPTHRVSFARIIGTDETGADRLGAAREIGAIWPRSGDKEGGILRLDHALTPKVGPPGSGNPGLLR